MGGGGAVGKEGGGVDEDGGLLVWVGGGRGDVAADEGDGGGFAGAVGAEEGEDFRGGDFDGEVVDGGFCCFAVAEGFGEVEDAEAGGVRCRVLGRRVLGFLIGRRAKGEIPLSRHSRMPKKMKIWRTR